ncbi:hypothetical protein JCM3765_005207 [Sporobolomyces pararoseus]
MSNSILPPPPAPRFPQEFTYHQDDGQESIRGNVEDLAEMQDVEMRGKGGGTTARWNLKTETEEHVQKLEDKLSQLSNSRLSHTCESPAAPLGRPPDLAEPDLSQLEDYSGDQAYDFDQSEDEAGEAAGHEEEGRALLSIAEASTEEVNGVTDEDEDGEENEADLSGNDGDNHDSHSRRNPGLSSHPFESMTTAQRISFSNSVRISGGIHTRPHRHRPPIETTFSRRSPSTERSNPISHHHRDARPETAPSPLLVASVTSSNVNSPSRATSPSGRISSTGHSSTSLNVLAPKPRRLSSSSHLSSSFNNHANATAYTSYYSASPGSQVPSRGSSPCSSIYAPLQPPSKHTPNPLFVRPSPRLQRQRSSGGSSGLSFQEYLREGYDAFEESDDDDSDAVSGGGGGRLPKSPGYRELVAEQRKKRAQWEERRRRRIEDKRKKLDEEEREGGERVSKNGGFWTGVKKFFAVGATSSSTVMAANTFGTGVGRAGGSFGSPTVFRNSSRLPTNVNYGSTHGQTSSSPSSSPILPPPKPRSILTSSHLPSTESLSSSPVNVNESLSPRTPRTRSRSSHSTKPPHPPPPPDKTELDSRFGPPPFRYFTLSYLIYKLESFFQAVKDLFSTASKGLAKQKERERLLRQRQGGGGGGYQAV